MIYSLSSHIVEVDVIGPGQEGNSFSVKTIRNNPASSGAVTGKQTYGSFLSSMFGMCSLKILYGSNENVSFFLFL